MEEALARETCKACCGSSLSRSAEPGEGDCEMCGKRLFLSCYMLPGPVAGLLGFGLSL